MRIENLEVKGFGRLADLNLELGKGLNIIFGKNESGKTSLQWFIKGMFFGLKGGRSSKDGMLPPLKRYKPWSARDFGGSLLYRLDNGELFRIERNFHTNTVRVFDAYFNDITDSFEQSREKGAHFAEKHLGVSELCFDKTVFVRQMESRIGDDGVGELVNRLINVGQTGFEDMSLNKAKEALKEALKIHVGTGKTTTRPLDKVNARLEELEALKQDITKKRESLFQVEAELKGLQEKKAMLEARREELSMLKEAAKISEALIKNRKIKEELDGILESIEADEAALRCAEAKLDEAEKDREQFKSFCTFSIDDSDRVSLEYVKLSSLMEDGRRIEREAAEKRNHLYNIEPQLEKLKAFNYMDEKVERDAVELSRDIENLKKEINSGRQDAVEEKMSTMQRKRRRYAYMTAAATALTVIMAVAGVMGSYAGYAAAAAAFVSALIFSVKRYKVAAMLNAAQKEKRLLISDIKAFKDQLIKKQKVLEEMYKSVGADGIEEFLVLKEKYNSLVRQVEAINSDIERLERDLENNEARAKALKGAIAAALHKAGIIDNAEAEISEDMIKSFKHGVRSCRELDMNIAYAKQRISDLKERVQKYCKNAASISGMTCGSKKELEEIAESIREKIAFLEEQLKGICKAKEMSEANGILPAEEIYEAEIEEVDEEIKEVLLKIRERETLLKSAGDDDELQRIIEEADALYEKKSELEDINTSLNTALEVLIEAGEELQRDFMPYINLKMSSAIDRISQGRYRDLRADSNLMLKVIAPETGEIVAAPALSGGTVDQMYLSLRVAMADLIGSTGEKLPFIMDEILAQYDDERTRETLEFLHQLSEERQIILFTCKGREVDIAREVCGKDINVVRLI
ncbi:AAA family ATPase [Pseudoclostridium thermosuccinogenes]|uniref:ATP-binding protein n=1 Tax=Clostridium thermosuccinogenes TaxID=84032 RepID=UPI002FDA0BFB